MWLKSYEEIRFQSGLNSSKVAPRAWKDTPKKWSRNADPMHMMIDV